MYLKLIDPDYIVENVVEIDLILEKAMCFLWFFYHRKFGQNITIDVMYCMKQVELNRISV